MQLVHSSKVLMLFLITATGLMAAEDVIQPYPRLPETTPWDLQALSKSPEFEWIDDKSPVRSLMYRGLEYRGKPTKVFAFYASPATLNPDEPKGKKYPGIVLIHGGGGTAFRE